MFVTTAVVLWAYWHRIRTSFGSPTAPPKPVVIKPTDLPGLGYLPDSTDAVLAIQMQFLLERLGPDAQANPAHALAELGLPDAVTELIDQASAVGVKNVDQLVLGLGFESHALPPELVLVVHARQPFDLDEIARQAKARPLKKDGRSLYVARAGPWPVYWWKAADRVLVATILARDFEDVPNQPRAGIDHLRPALASLIRESVADDACAWFVASSDKWDRYLRVYTDSILPLVPLQGRKDLIPPAERLRSVVVSVPHDPERPADVQISVKSADAGAQLREAFAERFNGDPIEVSGELEWARLQLPNDPKRIGSAIGRLVGNAR